jgi:hypothetical protein
MPKGSGGGGRPGRSGGGGGSALDAPLPDSIEGMRALRDKLNAEYDNFHSPQGAERTEASLEKWRQDRNRYIQKINALNAAIPRKVVGFSDKEKAALSQMRDSWQGPKSKKGSKLFTSEL